MFKTRRICLGGSFNPIHFGHLVTAREVARVGKYSCVCLIPAATSPFKVGQVGSVSAEDRCQMCRLATKNDALFEVLDVEILRPGPSYTIDTIRQLKAQGWPEVHWLIGADQLLDLPKWREALSLIADAHLVIIRRPGYEIDWSKLPDEYHVLKDRVVDAPLVDISATEIRRRVRAGESIDGLTPPEVVEYIKDKQLYLKSD
jgi:nicotinate-nucleotide adenylyltransferase